MESSGDNKVAQIRSPSARDLGGENDRFIKESAELKSRGNWFGKSSTSDISPRATADQLRDEYYIVLRRLLLITENKKNTEPQCHNVKCLPYKPTVDKYCKYRLNYMYTRCVCCNIFVFLFFFCISTFTRESRASRGIKNFSSFFQRHLIPFTKQIRSDGEKKHRLII